MGFFAAEVLLVFEGVYQLPTVPVTIITMPFILLAILDWIMVEGIVQFFTKSRTAGVITSGFKQSFCAWQTTVDLTVSIAWLVLDAKPWEIFTGQTEFVYSARKLKQA